MIKHSLDREMLFIVFDIEIVSSLPVGSLYLKLPGPFAVVEVILFIVTVLCVYAFV